MARCPHYSPTPSLNLGGVARMGAKVIRTPGNYDASVRAAADAARAHGWEVVSDASWLFGTEGATDLELYRRLVGNNAAASAAGRHEVTA